MTGPLLRVRIERLVLDGVEAGDGAAVARALEAELARRLARGGVPSLLAAAGDHPHLQAPTVQLDPATAPGVLGRRVAAALHAGLQP